LRRYNAMLRALNQQPVAVGMNVKPLQLYGGGLVQMADCPPASDDQINAINHAAVVGLYKLNPVDA
jgi:hypothetical protein